MPGIFDALTRRRVGGAVFVLVGLAVATIVLWPEGGDDSDPVPRQPVRLVSVPQLGLAVAHPSTWKQSVAGRVLRLRSADGSAVMTFAAPVKGSHARSVKIALKRALRKRLQNARTLYEGTTRLGNRRADSFELDGFGSDDKRVRALALIDSTPFLTYAVTLLTPSRPSRRRLAEAKQILATVRFTKPVRRPKPSR